MVVGRARPPTPALPRPSPSWADKFGHVVGVVHTNYLDYAAREEGGALKSAALAVVNSALVRAHTHKAIKLSDAVQPLPRSVTEFVHGVPAAFLDVGRKRAAALERAHGGGGGWGSRFGRGRKSAAAPGPAADASSRPASATFARGAYFIGKAVWAKGYTELLDLVEATAADGGGGSDNKRSSSSSPSLARVDCYGGGEDLPALRAAAAARALPLAFHGPRDHLDARMHDYRVLVNPSTSDVVATTTAEALAMGKWVVVADLPCNAWFGGFRNTLRYRTPAEFAGALRHALAHDPHPVTADEAAALSWEAATQRFLDAAELAPGERPSGPAAAADRALYRAHNALTAVEQLRAAVGAGAGTRDAPPCLATWRPGAAASTGLFDRRGAGAAPRAARRALLGGA
jgi:digalactosyldiacylglycerol synthase